MRREQTERELPALRERARKVESEKRELAKRETTISGQLRQAISDSGIAHQELARQVGVSGRVIAEFLIGSRSLDSTTIDRIAALLKQELRPIG